MSRLLRTTLALLERAHLARFEGAAARPDLAQAAVLRSLLAGNVGTAFGRAHGFAAIRTPAEFARHVPIRDYEAFRPWVDRVVAGEGGVLTREDPVAFATTSGTTGLPKLVPVTVSWQAQMAALVRLWTRCALRDHPTCLDRRAFTIVSPAVEARTAAGLPVGALSGMMHRGLPWLIRRRQAVPYPVALIADCEARYFVTVRLALAQAVSVVATPNPSSLLRLVEVADEHWEALVRAICDGTLGIPEPGLRDQGGVDRRAARDAIRAPLRPAPARARQLEAARARHGVLRLDACWPGLALVGCWLGGNPGIQARRLAEHFGDVPLRDLGLVASEGRITVPIDDGTPAGVLAVHAGFFEFVPEEAIDAPSPEIRLAHELEDGRRYYVLLSGGNGLYRYDLNDIVAVQGFLGRTPRLAFVRKGRDMVSVTGEKLHVNQLEAAARAAEDETGLRVFQYRVIPDVEASRYDLLVEPRGGDGAARSFLRAYDAALARLNGEYATKRASRRLGPPRLWLMRAGLAERQCRADFRRGQREAQYKWPAIRLEWDDASRADVTRCVEADPDGADRRVRGRKAGAP